MTGNEIVARARQLSKVRYWYGGKGQIATKQLADILKKQNPSVWTDGYYKNALADIDGITRVGDCSFLVCYAYNRSQIGSYTIKDTYAWWNKEPLNGMILWRPGHVAIYGDGYAIQLKSQAVDYTEIPYKNDNYDAILFDKGVNYMNEKPSKTGWNQLENGNWIYKFADETSPIGWAQLNGDWYLFDDLGIMLTGWQDHKGKIYHLRADGKMDKGTIYLGGFAYVLSEEGQFLA